MYKKEPMAIARLKGSNKYPEIQGVVRFYDVPGGTEVEVEVWGLPNYVPAIDTPNDEPIGPHGFHIHERGICEITNPKEPFESAGEHWNPTKQPHGNHAGDFPVVFSNDGYGSMKFFTDKFKPKDVICKSVLIHENPDDYRSQPAGNSGERIACGIICGVMY